MQPPAATEAREEGEAAAAPRGSSRRDRLARGWRAALREFAIIVAGVLCALAAQ